MFIDVHYSHMELERFLLCMKLGFQVWHFVLAGQDFIIREPCAKEYCPDLNDKQNLRR